ncbi:ArnT family glycosyltransferase [Planktothrix agardhii]|uniref:Undecaprenyl phosphate-alpha-4-amino-4-deoxy-L-arabinose arabinosyl transferase n=1 Tax=Planktothrix agardhii TaxID=1160 RepID=A0AAD1V3A2_PLAAG|nr:glycosyltransferase family 39 protein [Planktothrix agardhii]CAD5950724.1 Undecaprenyl phosphate-alpha-4-amino-4-deoxy-L-arabinose arabinosyl transferase [Planktothrix agardhii]
MKSSSNRKIPSFFLPLLKTPGFPWLVFILGLGLIGFLAFFWNLGTSGLLDETEPLFAESARQMLVNGDWITPYFNQETRFDKPPLIYWLMAISYQIVGVNEWGVRLPSAFSGFLLVCLGFYTLSYYVQQTQFYTIKDNQKQDFISPLVQPGFRKIILHPLPWMGALLIAFNPGILAWARIGVSDMLLTGCLGSALLAFFLGYAKSELQEGQDLPPGFNSYKIWYLAFYILTALAVLTKGPVGIVLPILIIGSFLIYLGEGRKVLKEMDLLKGSLIFLVITISWYVLVILVNGQNYINSFFGYHNFQRFTTVVNHHSAPWYFYFIVVLVGFAPFSVYLPPAIASTKFWKRRYWQHQTRIKQLQLFAVFWFGGIFIFFTLAVTKLPSYILPLIPASVLLVSLFWNNIISKNSFQKNKFNSLNIAIFINILFVFLASIGSYFSKNLIGYDADMADFRGDLQASGIPNISALIWVITTLGIVLSWWKGRISSIFIVNILGFIVFFIVAVTPTYSLLDQHRQEPLRHLAQTVVQQRKLGEELIMIGFKKPSLVFYTQHRVQYRPDPRDAIAYIQTPLVQKSPPQTLLILAHPQELIDLGLKPDQYQIMDQAGAYQLIRVHKT